MAKGAFPCLCIGINAQTLISICIRCLVNAIFLLRNLPFCLNRSCLDLICSLPFLSQRRQQKSIDSNKSICALSLFFPLSLAIALLSTGKSLNRELSAVYSTLSVFPLAISIGILAWSTGQSVGLGINSLPAYPYLD